MCPKCNKQTVSRIDNIFVELFGHCWMCDFDLVKEGKLTEDEFKKHEQNAINKKYGK